MVSTQSTRSRPLSSLATIVAMARASTTCSGTTTRVSRNVLRIAKREVQVARHALVIRQRQAILGREREPDGLDERHEEQRGQKGDRRCDERVGNPRGARGHEAAPVEKERPGGRGRRRAPRPVIEPGRRPGSACPAPSTGRPYPSSGSRAPWPGSSSTVLTGSLRSTMRWKVSM